MADKFVVKAEKREGRGKNDSRRLRRDGRIPVSIYGGGGETLALTANLSDLAAVLRSESGVNTVFSVEVEGVASDVIFHDRQIDPIKGRLMHADLRRMVGGDIAEFEAKVEAEAQIAADAAEARAVAEAEAEEFFQANEAAAEDATGVEGAGGEVEA